MRKILSLIILIFLIYSCSRSKEMKPVNYSYKKESVIEKPAIITEQFKYQIITKQKLQEYYDLLVLQKKHPEFKNDILAQLQKISSINKKLKDTNSIKINNLELISTNKTSETERRIKISFDVISNNKIKKDTTIVLIKTKKVIIDNRELVSNKIRFY